ncbi:transketolase [Traorella massiliensis]|uniref:transketolase n=1 Tax=Traorella massiliensis TaxID=1903263 RepID=UPI0008F95CC7|nr:transketolase [Traorella massiliensis]
MLTTQELKQHSVNIRKNIIKMVTSAQSGHPGGSLSSADMITYLYFNVMDINQDNVKGIDRDRFVLSKGHASPLLYAVLSEKGFIDEEELMTFRKINSNLQGHPNMLSVDGVDMSTGSLGQGISAAVGMAMANKLDQNDHRIYALLGDGESQEGQVWEAAMAAAHYKLDNLCVILDYNGLQIDGSIHDVMDPSPLDEKFKAFGWHVIEIDGHNYEEIGKAFAQAKTIKGQPTLIFAHTIKGKGVSFMENQSAWHGVAPNAEQCALALKELDGE